MTDLGRRLADAETVVAACAEVALKHFRIRDGLSIDRKGPRDFASEADRAVERAAMEQLALLYPGEPLIGEEYGGDAAGDHWIIDPIDGTTNFLNGLPLWAVSLAFMRGQEPVVGVIALPALGESIAAAKAMGLRTSGIASSAPHAVDGPLVGVGRNGRWPAIERFRLEQDLEARGLSVVCLGSCATSLAMVATGRLAGYVERSVKPWDVAAGALLCTEAGLTVAVSNGARGMDVMAGRMDLAHGIGWTTATDCRSAPLTVTEQPVTDRSSD